MRTIHYGSTGPEVATLQRALGVHEDGKFGSQTEKALKAWQAAHGLAPDGVAGPATWASLGMLPALDIPPAARARLQRAESACGSVRYGLGLGGVNPKAAKPGQWAIRKLRPGWYCDCAGFVAWDLGRSRKPDPGWWSLVDGKRVHWWFSTDSVWRDARTEQQLFVLVEDGAERPGDIAVYPDYRGPDGKLLQGHIAIVADPRTHEVYDCGSTSGGISRRRLSVMWNKASAIFCRPKGEA